MPRLDLTQTRPRLQKYKPQFARQPCERHEIIKLWNSKVCYHRSGEVNSGIDAQLLVAPRQAKESDCRDCVQYVPDRYLSLVDLHVLKLDGAYVLSSVRWRKRVLVCICSAWNKKHSGRHISRWIAFWCLYVIE